MILFLAAQTASLSDPLTGGAGWASAGLFGLVLGWLLMIHLPAKDKQITGLIESFVSNSKAERADFRIALDRVVAHCDEAGDRERAATNKALEMLQIAMETARQIAVVQQHTNARGAPK